MTDWRLSGDESQQIFDERISPVVFPNAPPDDAPHLLFVASQPGAGAMRATPELTSDGTIAVLSASDLRPFHPRFVDLSRTRSPEALHVLSESTTGWMRSALQYARTTRRSLLLDGTLSSPDMALATTGLFAKSGFTTTVVVVAVPRAESLLATASKYLLEARTGRASPFTSVTEHDAAFEGTRTLVQRLEATPSVDRLTIIGRDGVTRFEGARSDPAGLVGAGAAVDREHAAQLPAPQAMRWLSELRAVTDYALSSRQVARPLAEVLIELNEVGLREILPHLPLPKDSQARPATEANLGRQLVALRQAVRAEQRPERRPVPVISTPEPDRGISI